VAAGVVPQGALRFTLPGLPSPLVRLVVRGRDSDLATNLDTVIIDADQRRVLLLWRGCFPLVSGPVDVTDIAVLESAAAAVR
jgi:hypothetical protein